jgi:hypothetical protein
MSTRDPKRTLYFFEYSLSYVTLAVRVLDRRMR